MNEMIAENKSKYLDLNRFLVVTTPTPNTRDKRFKYPHDGSKHSKLWTQDDRYKFLYPV